MESIGQSGRALVFARLPCGRVLGRQIEQEQVHRPVLEESGRHRQGLAQRTRCQDDEPLEANAAGDGLDGVQAAG